MIAIIIFFLIIVVFKQRSISIIMAILSIMLFKFAYNSLINDTIIEACIYFIIAFILFYLAVLFIDLPESIEADRLKFGNKLNVKIDCNNMNGIEFEKYCCSILKNRGFTNINRTQDSYDNGVDIIAYRNNYKYAIQCKRYKGSVGNKAVQEVYSGKAFYNCARAMVISNSIYTKSAIELAGKLDVELVTL